MYIICQFSLGFTQTEDKNKICIVKMLCHYYWWWGGGFLQYFSIWQPRPLVEIYITGSIPICKYNLSVANSALPVLSYSHKSGLDGGFCESGFEFVEGLDMSGKGLFVVFSSNWEKGGSNPHWICTSKWPVSKPCGALPLWTNQAHINK